MFSDLGLALYYKSALLLIFEGLKLWILSSRDYA